MTKHKGTFQFGRVNNIAKAKMVTKKIPVKEGFTCSGTMWIPKATLQKPAPLISFTLSTGDSSARLTSENIGDIKLALLQMVDWIESVEDEFEEAQKIEFQNWIELHTAQMEAMDSMRKEKREKLGKTIKLKTK
jgi:hypothetical protein